MVSGAPEQLRRDAERVFRESALPEAFDFYQRLDPLHQRLFLIELWDALSRATIGGDAASTEALAELVESWEATADLDSAPEVVEAIQTRKSYRRLDI